MKIGCAVLEDSRHWALLQGLRQRWCAGAELALGYFRGSTRVSLRREIKNACIELRSKGVGVFVFITDADDQPWREVKANELRCVPNAFRPFTLYAVADRNVECWLAADPGHLARELGIDPSELHRAQDPKGTVDRALRHLTVWEDELRVAAVVERAPLRAWIEHSASFEEFYEDARGLALRQGCAFPNERER